MFENVNWKKFLGMGEDEPEVIGASQLPEEVPAEEESGSGYKVPYTKILDIQPHPRPEVLRLEIATVYGFQVVVGKGKFKVGDQVIYIPIDSVISPELEELLIGPNAKIKLNKRRIRQINIQKMASQGMIVSPSEVSSLVNVGKFKDEQDLRSILNIRKYEPPVKQVQGPTTGKSSSKRNPHPDFHKYNGLGNIKWFPLLFKEGQEVVIQEKLHGTNARASVLPFRATTLWKRIQLALKIAPKTQNCYGSNNVEISAAPSYKGFYGEDVYGSVFKKLDVFSKLKLGESIFGEIVGPGIQKGYSYGLKEHQFVLFDVKVMEADGSQKWLSPIEVKEFAISRGFQYVPVVYQGPFNKEEAYKLTTGPSVFDPNEKVREGIVIKAAENYSIEGNKQAVKWVSEVYLADDTNTDDH